jgi:hypothetical protein
VQVRLVIQLVMEIKDQIQRLVESHLLVGAMADVTDNLVAVEARAGVVVETMVLTATVLVDKATEAKV